MGKLFGVGRGNNALMRIIGMMGMLNSFSGKPTPSPLSSMKRHDPSGFFRFMKRKAKRRNVKGKLNQRQARKRIRQGGNAGKLMARARG